MFRNRECYSSIPITVQASLRVRKLALHSNRSYGYAFRSRAALSNTSPHVSSGGEMITQRRGGRKGNTDYVSMRTASMDLQGALCAPQPVQAIHLQFHAAHGTPYALCPLFDFLGANRTCNSLPPPNSTFSCNMRAE
jgi:hypothetical protein